MLTRLVAELPEFFSYYNIVFLAKAALATFALSAVGSITGVLAGFALAVTRLTRSIWLAPLRSLMLVFFAFQLSGFDLPLFAVALIAVFLIASAYLAEIIRAGFESVHRNQWDAAAAMNFSMLETIRYVIVPQAWRIILPPAFGFFILFIKDTALASQIGVIELTYAGKVLNNKGFSAALVFGTLLVLYFLISYPLMRLGARLEASLAQPRHR
jgi:polar amino acid transport system permease protein